MRSFRHRLSERLLESGAQSTLECQEMWRRARQAGISATDPAFARVVGAVEFRSAVAIRLGMLLMPRKVVV
jgi:uncharacterized membrane protein YjjP (DUF1212 family)